MKKILIAFMLVSFFGQAQWKEIEGKDDFGDVNGKVRNIINQEGIFSNSATSRDVASIFIEKTNSSIGFALSDYNGATNTYFKDVFNISIKKVNGTIIKDVKTIDTYSKLKGYKSIKWISFNKVTKLNISISDARKELKPLKRKYGHLTVKDIPKEISDRMIKLIDYIAFRYLAESPLYQGFLNLKIGDRIVIRVDSSKYSFEIK